MGPIRLRTLVATIGLIVTLAIFVSVPCGYFYVRYASTANELTYKAEQAAARVAKYIYLHRTLWQYQAPRIAEQIDLDDADGDNFALSVRNEAGVAIAAAGPELPAPVLVRNHPLVVSGAVIGRIEARSSLRPLLWETSVAVLVSAILGIGVYFAVRIFPLTVLDRTVGALEAAKGTIEDRNKQLGLQNDRFDTALTNMSQGLCMFDADAKLVIFNPRFAEIYGLPPENILPGMTTRQLMALALSTTKVADADPEGTLALQQNFIRDRKAGSVVQGLTDGRSISILHRPMPGGGFVVTFEDITERLFAEEKIKHLAHYDALTDLPNRVTFYERMETILNHLRRSESIAVLSLDLDHFKSVNDTLGHPVGDLLLRAAAGRMRSCVRGEDIVARLGGDEFAILQVPSEHTPDVTALAARLIEVVGAPYDLDGHQVIVNVSIGIAIAPGDSDEPDVLMKNADLALYRSKADGGGVYRFFEVAMDARMQARRALELDLRRAIVSGEFELYYQPIINVKTGQITSCEALIRWHHPERGLVAPLDFISVAEETGIIVQIGEWVLRQACAEAARWPKHVTISVNVSPAQFKSRNLVPTVVSALATSGLPASRMELEITEMVLVQENEGAFIVLHQLRDLGIRIAMDDFGTGYSSLGYLRSFPFDKIKIDQSFIRDLPTKGDSVAIVRAVVGLSSSLGITTTAEGVETEAQLASLTSEGCNEFQGFLFSPPRPAEEVARMLGELNPRAAAVA
jgi:diguanylate cyclase (GGDEF)-like protein/PAS domain S-box-containing protein